MAQLKNIYYSAFILLMMPFFASIQKTSTIKYTNIIRNEIIYE
jgi:hypothetical protein